MNANQWFAGASESGAFCGREKGAVGSYTNASAEDYNRLRKAIRLADVITLSGLSVDDMSDGASGSEFWKVAARGAFPDEPRYSPSEDTRRTVFQLLADRESTAKRLLEMEGITI
jgi:hypothetical protein